MTDNGFNADTDGRSDEEAIEHSYEDDVRPSVAAVETAAAVTGRPVTDLPRLHESVDAEALDSMFDRARSESHDALEVGFRYAGIELSLSQVGGELAVRVTDIHD